MASELSHTGRALADLGQQLRAQRERAEHLAERVEACERVLRMLEFSNGDESCPCCYCEAHEDAPRGGHGVDCALDAALRMGGTDGE